jgi:hypothetical protein
MIVNEFSKESTTLAFSYHVMTSECVRPDLVLAAQRHDALTTYGFVMTTVVLPLSVVTLLVVAWREWCKQPALVTRSTDTKQDTPAP